MGEALPTNENEICSEINRSVDNTIYLTTLID